VRIKERRTNLGMSQGRLAAAIGVSFQQVQKYERAISRVSASRLYLMSRALDVPVPYFFSEEPAEGFDADPLRRRETVELINALYQIADAGLRQLFLKLARSLAATPHPPRRRGRRRKSR
jgi:transcriptional regulator with XRE-family HTH domain